MGPTVGQDQHFRTNGGHGQRMCSRELVHGQRQGTAALSR